MSILSLREDRAAVVAMIEDEERLIPALKRYDIKKLAKELKAIDNRIAEHLENEDAVLKAAAKERELTQAELLTALDTLYQVREDLNTLAPRAKDGIKGKCFDVSKALSQILKQHKPKEEHNGEL